MKTSNTTPWQRFLIRIAQDPFFLSSALNAYRAAHDLDPQQLGEWLRCPHTSLDRLALCRLPDDEEPRFQEGIRKIAGFVPCDADRLVTLLREVAALRSLRDTREALPASLLMAARDRKKRKEDKP